jgi:DNA/RNA-binding domain of Phe-tRNA-synthetase-like protein
MSEATTLPTITIVPGLPVRIGYVWLQHCRNSVQNQVLNDQLATTAKLRQQNLAGRQLSDDPTIQAVRQLFRAIGIDPMRYRPSGEALLRRAIKGEVVRSINPLVDCNNIVSMETGLPFGCYDAARIGGNITIRLGLVGEQYQGVAKPIDIAEKLCAADTIGPFGSPISDSDRTKTTEQTTQVLLLCFGHTTTPPNIMTAALERFIGLTWQHLQAELLASSVI